MQATENGLHIKVEIYYSFRKKAKPIKLVATVFQSNISPDDKS